MKKEHKHKWYFVRKYNLGFTSIDKDCYEFVCICGKVKIVNEKERQERTNNQWG